MLVNFTPGHGLVLKQYRNGVEVTPPIDQDLNYDFNFQQIRTIPSRKIYPVSNCTICIMTVYVMHIYVHYIYL